jgi:tRNA(Phe) wybutosine-synthesizing methylase Tyw3
MPRRKRRLSKKRYYEHLVTLAEATLKKLEPVTDGITDNFRQMSRHIETINALDVLISSKGDEQAENRTDLCKIVETALREVEALGERMDRLNQRAQTERAELARNKEGDRE